MSVINSSQRVVNLILFAFRILAIGFLIGFILPYKAAEISGVLYDKDVRTKIENDKRIDVSKTLQRQTDNTFFLLKTLQKVDSVLLTLKSNSLNNDNLENSLRYRDYIKQLLNEKKQLLRIGGFYLGSTMLLWPMTLTFLGWLVFLAKPKVDSNDKINFLGIIRLFFGLWLTYRLPVWLRNSIFSGGDRKYYGHANFDIDLLGFIVQEFQCICIVILLV
uniref:hypothetical protein n=1 Tax=Spirosoma sp. TaxID=1899569 RepID=UPI003B3BD305